jgi:hypothetical protein
VETRITLPNEKHLIITGISENWTLRDLLEELLEYDEINEELFMEIERDFDLSITVSENVDFGLGKLENKAPGYNPDSKLVPQVAPGKSNRLGLKRVSHDNNDPKRGLSKLTKSNPVKVPERTINPVKVPERTKSVEEEEGPGEKHVTTQKYGCSKTKKSWIAHLLSDSPPRTLDDSISSNKGSTYGKIHLVLDDSVSMDSGGKDQQQKAGARSFLAEREVQDEIMLHTVNTRNITCGDPISVSRFLEGISPDYGTPMGKCFEDLNSHVVGDDIVIFFSDGGTTDYSPLAAGNVLKKKGTRIITIGCGSADEGTLRGLASGDTDYHHAANPGNILEVFQKVSHSLMQLSDSASVDDKNSISAKQIHSTVFLEQRGNTTQNSTEKMLSAEQGYDRIEEFSCHHCNNTQRIMCPACDEQSCGGGNFTAKIAYAGHLETTFTCPYCQNSGPIRIVETLQSGVSKLGSKGKKVR